MYFEGGLVPQRRVPTASWTSKLAKLGDEYLRRARQLFSMRCAQCGVAGCLLRGSSVHSDDNHKTAPSDMQEEVGQLLRSLRRQAWVTGKELGCDCNSLTCFLCKSEASECGCGDHRGDGKARSQGQAKTEKVPLQYCPVCDVGVAETPGCVSVLCVCGKYFEWSNKE